jgi:hypothetical protein
MSQFVYGRYSPPRERRLKIVELEPGRKQLVCPCCGDYCHEPDDAGCWQPTKHLECGCNGEVVVRDGKPRAIGTRGCDCGA